MRHANQLKKWLEALLTEYQDHILDINQDIAQLRGWLRVPHSENVEVAPGPVFNADRANI